MSVAHSGEVGDDLVPITVPAAVPSPGPVAVGPVGLFSVSPGAKRFALSTARIVATVAVTVAVNPMALAIAIPIGIHNDDLFTSIAVTEGGLLAICLVVAVVLAARARVGQSASVLVGWAAAYLGLIGVVVAVIVALCVLVFGVMAVFWILAVIFQLS
jgi:hypothetical protein